MSESTNQTKPKNVSEPKMKRRPPKIWTEEQKMILKRLYPDSTMKEIIAALNNEFNAHQIMHKAQKMCLKKSAAFRERFGLDEDGRLTGKAAPHNKGKKFEAGGYGFYIGGYHFAFDLLEDAAKVEKAIINLLTEARDKP